MNTVTEESGDCEACDEPAFAMRMVDYGAGGRVVRLCEHHVRLLGDARNFAEACRMYPSEEYKKRERTKRVADVKKARAAAARQRRIKRALVAAHGGNK